MGKHPEAVTQLEAAHRLFSDLGADPYVRRCAEELELHAGPRRSAESGGHTRPEPGRNGCGPTGRHRPHQPRGGRRALCFREDRRVPPPQLLHQARHHLSARADRPAPLSSSLLLRVRAWLSHLGVRAYARENQGQT